MAGRTRKPKVKRRGDSARSMLWAGYKRSDYSKITKAQFADLYAGLCLAHEMTISLASMKAQLADLRKRLRLDEPQPEGAD